MNKQLEELRAAALAATPGRVGDRIDGSGSIKYECVGYDGSVVLRTDHKNMEYGFVGDNSDADELFFRRCVPDVILSALAELEKSQQRSERLDAMLTESVEELKAAEQTLEREREKSRRVMSENQQQAQRIAELERYVKDRDAENEGLAMTVGKLRSKLATPVRLPECWDVSGQVNPPRIVQVQFEQQNRTRNQCAEAIRAAGFKVEGDA